ncbi:MAG: DNA polymerase-3 subunit gamma/tau, partial [Arenicella sp.]
MAYLALARKWRPKAFSEVVGQSHVVQALSNALDSGRVHHAFLFTGTRGVGKTTLARIFAKSLNCEQGTSAEPCQICGTCTSIDEGRYVDLIEVDAASRTKVDDTRELLENIHYAPSVGKFKVFLIDEVHMLSTHSFNAMLKTLEEPPEHVKFLFATTDPQKLPVTILSRCLQFNLRAMRPDQVENQLVKILGSEGIEFDQAALHAIAKAADGSMRDGLSLLDQAIAQGGGSVKLADVESMLGTIKSAQTEAILRALADQDIDQALSVVAEMADSSVDFSVALDDVLMQLYYVSLAQLAPNSLSATDANQALITSVAQAIPVETLQLFYQIGLISKRDIPLAPSLRVGFEMALLRMLAFEPNDPLAPQAAPGPQVVPTAQLAPTAQAAPTPQVAPTPQ